MVIYKARRDEMGKVAKGVKIAIISAFVAVQTVLFALFLAEDFGTASVGDNAMLKFATVICAFLFAGVLLALNGRAHLADNILLVLGLACTIVSDLFLLVLGDYLEIGLVTFICAQLFYFARIRRTKVWLVCSVAVRVSLSAIAIIVLASLKQADALYILVAIYFVQLVMNLFENVALAFVGKEKALKAQGILLSVAFLLFVGCDISVGLSNLYDGMANEFIWLFYTPSQTLIALSGRGLYEKV